MILLLASVIPDPTAISFPDGAGDLTMIYLSGLCFGACYMIVVHSLAIAQDDS